MNENRQMVDEQLDRLLENGVVSRLDIHFAHFVAGIAEDPISELTLSAALISSATRQGHICLDLDAMAEKTLVDGEEGQRPIICPKLRGWCKGLNNSQVVGTPGDYKPLILDGCGRLYLFRYWDYQVKLADLIRNRVCEVDEPMDIQSLGEGLARLFTGSPEEGVDWQQVAAFTSVMKKFCVISGGPGTGKTTTVAKILALLLEQPSQEKSRIALCSPTGKGAARLQEAIQAAKSTLECSAFVKEAIPTEASTIHRLLGAISHSPYFRYNAQNKLPLDVIVVDEASMVDLALMSKLFQALKPEARLILLGDKDQLASVEAGAVLGDICDTGHDHGFSVPFFNELKKVIGHAIPLKPDKKNEPGIGDCIVTLRKSYRFKRKSGIATVSRAVNEGEGDRARELITGGEYKDIQWHGLPHFKDLAQAIRKKVVQGFGDYLKAGEPQEIFALFNRFRILCALREGPYGVLSINGIVEQILKEKGLITLNERWYRGRPILINRNDYNLQLFNGDVGILLQDSDSNNNLRAFFQTPDGNLRKIHPLRLPEHETVYAMTVHKSQGAEFDQVVLMLTDRDSPVLARELVYTGLTRAKEKVEIWGEEAVFDMSVARRTERMSGLRDALWG
jgi:exodeoxyribonuclease V alpha subunit